MAAKKIGSWDFCLSISSRDLNEFQNLSDKDIAIYNTEDGVLFDKSVIDKNAEIVEIPKNIKRDYSFASYKDQIADLQLKKELADKRKKEGILTEKQKKAVEEQLKIENEIRQKLKKIFESFENKIKLLYQACKKSNSGAYEHLSLLYDVILPLTKSPLVSKLAVKGVLCFRDAIFQSREDNLEKIIAQASLRALGAKFLMDHWCESPLDEQLQQMFLLLSSTCMMLNYNSEDSDHEGMEDEEDKESDLAYQINASRIAFLIPLLEEIFVKNPLNYALNVRIRASSFLKSAVSKKIIKIDEITTMPMMYLCNVLLDALVSPISTDYREELFNVADSLFAILNLSTDFSNNEKINSLLEGLLYHAIHQDDSVLRLNVLKLVSSIQNFLFLKLAQSIDIKENLRHVLFLAKHDVNADCVKIADSLWSELGLTCTNKFFETIVHDLYSKNKLIRQEASESLKSLIIELPFTFEEVLNSLSIVYLKYTEVEPAKFDAVGRVLQEEVDPWQERAGIANAYVQIAEHMPENLPLIFIKSIVPRGLNDKSETCRSLMRNASILCLKKHGQSIMDELLPYLEEELGKLPKQVENDNLCQGLIVLIGTLAQYIKDDDNKVRKIVGKLIEVLSTPSQQVQESVAGCLPALVPSLKDGAKDLVQNLMIILTNAESYGERRGAAYGIAAMVKGLGVSSIKEMDISNKLKALLAQKQKPICREGALLCIEMFCGTIGKLFEPYLVQLLYDILNSFGDQSEVVRRAADDTARAMMRSLSAHGVRLILPSLLKALEEDSWRTKCAAVELLGAMSNCAPRQLSASLPSIVPKLCEVLTDTSTKVQREGEKALKQIAKVIQNPEILAISQHLIQALVDPSGKTTTCLQIIVNNKFVHYVDSPSLALMTPIIYRAFEERNTDARRMAAQIIANIYSLVDHTDMEPYLKSFMPGLRKSLLDPVPEVRTVSSKAIGSIVRYSAPSTSEKIQSEIMPWLKENLVSKTSTVDRTGAAQGLSEVVAALGEEFLKQNIAGIVKITESPNIDPFIRDGYLLLFIYLPIALGEKFVPYIEMIIPSILKALADENEYVRDSALRSGQRLISNYSGHAKKLLLPKLQTALIHENWRIRHASVKLIGEFLFNISGVSGKMTSDTTGEDDTMGSEQVSKVILRQIGQRTRDEVLAAIYLARSDVALVVRQAAGHVWKVIVPNTPRTLKELLKPLFELLLICLSSPGTDRKQTAARCLSEVVKKMGEKTLGTVLPILEARLTNTSAECRCGVMVAFHEIITNVSRDVVEGNQSSLVKSIKSCLSDQNSSVREAASHTFASFHNMIGAPAVDDIAIPLLDEFTQNQNMDILEGLCALMAGPSSRTLFNTLLSKLNKPPVNSAALCRLLSVAGDSLSRNLTRCLDALLSKEIDTTIDEHVQNCMPVLLSLESDEDIRSLLSYLLKQASSSNGILSSILLKEYLSNVEDGVPDDAFDMLISGLLSLYISSNSEIVENVIEALTVLITPMDQERKCSLVLIVKKSAKLLSTLTKGRTEEPIQGLCVANGWSPVNSILREGLLHGNIEVKEASGVALTQLIQMSDEAGLKPHAVNMAGPLIRVLGTQHNPSPVKIAVLSALNKLMDKLTPTLKPFLPQMQSVFLKMLYADEPSKNLRQLTAESITRMLDFHPKPELVFKELSKISDEKGLKDDTLLDELLDKALEKINIQK